MRFFDEDPGSVVQPETMVRSLVSCQGVQEDLELEALALVTFTSYDLNRWIKGISPVRAMHAWRKRGYRIDRLDGYVVVQSSIGAPGAAMLLEELAAFGVRRAIFFGYCGSLRKDVRVGDVVIPTEAIREEGTSYHYLPEGRRCFPDLSLQETLDGLAQASGVRTRRGVVWTTDAPYRETPGKVHRYREEGVVGVEMEMAALFAVGSVRDLSIGALLIVSDELGGGVWKAAFFSNELKETRERLICALRPRLKALQPRRAQNSRG